LRRNGDVPDLAERTLRRSEPSAAATRAIRVETPRGREAEFQTALDLYIAEYKNHHAESMQKANWDYSPLVFVQWLWR
jgi:hypothetical protein